MQVTTPQLPKGLAGTQEWLKGTVTKQFDGEATDPKARTLQDDLTQVYADSVSYAHSHPEALSYWKHSYYINLEGADLTATRMGDEPKRSTAPSPFLDRIEKSAHGFMEVPEDTGRMFRFVASDQPDSHHSLTADRSFPLFGSEHLSVNEENIFTGNIDHAVFSKNGDSKFSVNKDHLAWLSRPYKPET